MSDMVFKKLNITEERAKTYYMKMMLRDRLMPIYVNNGLRGLITFYIGNGDMNKYTDRDHWTLVEDEPRGDTCYIDQLVTTQDDDNPVYAWITWKHFADFIRRRFLNVKRIIWTRIKGGRRYVYIKRFYRPH